MGYRDTGVARRHECRGRNLGTLLDRTGGAGAGFPAGRQPAADSARTGAQAARQPGRQDHPARRNTGRTYRRPFRDHALRWRREADRGDLLWCAFRSLPGRPPDPAAARDAAPAHARRRRQLAAQYDSIYRAGGAGPASRQRNRDHPAGRYPRDPGDPYLDRKRARGRAWLDRRAARPPGRPGDGADAPRARARLAGGVARARGRYVPIGFFGAFHRAGG